MREKGLYEPPEDAAFLHIDAAIKALSVLTGDSRFEERIGGFKQERGRKGLGQGIGQQPCR